MRVELEPLDTEWAVSKLILKTLSLSLFYSALYQNFLLSTKPTFFLLLKTIKPTKPHPSWEKKPKPLTPPILLPNWESRVGGKSLGEGCEQTGLFPFSKSPNKFVQEVNQKRRKVRSVDPGRLGDCWAARRRTRRRRGVPVVGGAPHRAHHRRFVRRQSKARPRTSWNSYYAGVSSDRTNLSPFTKDYRGLALPCDFSVFVAREGAILKKNIPCYHFQGEVFT